MSGLGDEFETLLADKPAYFFLESVQKKKVILKNI